MSKYFVDAVGNYLGAFDGAKQPNNSVEVATPPQHALDKFQDGEWIAYTPPEPTAAEELASSDAGMARMTEDLIDTLITKGVISSADLPQMAQDKLNNRKVLRAKL
jgi:hypothetical protein